MSKVNRVKKTKKMQKVKKSKKLEKLFKKYLNATLLDDPVESEDQCLALQVEISTFMQNEPISKAVFDKTFKKFIDCGFNAPYELWLNNE